MLYFLLGSVIVNCVQGLFSLDRAEHVRRLRAEIKFLEACIPKHDAKGRFAKKR